MVKAKKALGQHFLKDENIAKKITNSLKSDFNNLIEIGPGTGVLTKYLVKNNKFVAIEVDRESYDFLLKENILIEDQIIFGNFLKLDLESLFSEKTAIIGNFPYNISSQILFKIYDNKDSVIEMVGMFQKEVADRIVSDSGSKKYGILSVLLQAFYDIEYLFTVDENVFNPPPKVKSGVIRLNRNSVKNLDCKEDKFAMIVKQSFNHRRKMIRKSLKQYIDENVDINNKLFTLRPEDLDVAQFVELTNILFPR